MNKTGFRPFRPSEVLTPTSSVDVSIQDIGMGHKVVVVDRFYAHPERVRDLALDCPSAIWIHEEGGANFESYYDCRLSLNFCEHNSENYAAYRLIDQLSEHHLDIRAYSIPKSFEANLLLQKTPRPVDSQSLPHRDGNSLAALVCLNLPDECSGGTAFYQVKKNALTLPSPPPEGRSHFLRQYDQWFDLMDVVPMKWNRLLVYPGTVFHGAWIPQTAFQQYPRVNQVIFMNPASYGRSWKRNAHGEYELKNTKMKKIRRSSGL